MKREGSPEGSGEAISEMREQLEALRKQRDALVQAQAEEQAEAAARELARREAEERRRREQARKEEKEEAEARERERREQERKERKEREQRERERREKQREERERIARQKTATSTKNKSTGTTSTPQAPPTAGASSPKKSTNKSNSSEGWGGLLVVVLIIGVLIWQPWEKQGDDTPTSSPTPRFTMSSCGGTSGLGAGDSLGDTDTDTDSSSGSSSGGSDDTEPEPEPEPETSSPEPDPTEDAFKAVSYGDCLDVVDTGYGGLSRYDWSEEEPNTTSCGYGTRVQVTGTTGDCESGVGKATWSYYSTSSGERTALCLTGQYHQGDCLLAKHEGNNVSSIAMLSSPNCTDRRVPAAYNEILVVTNIYRATAGTGTEVCRHGQYDTNTYWSTKVDDGATLLCFKAYD